MIIVYTGSAKQKSVKGVNFLKDVPSFVQPGFAKAIETDREFQLYDPKKPYDSQATTIFVQMPTQLDWALAAKGVLAKIRKVYPKSGIKLHIREEFAFLFSDFDMQFSLTSEHRETYYREYDCRVKRGRAYYLDNFAMTKEQRLLACVDLYEAEIDKENLTYTKYDVKVKPETVYVLDGETIANTIPGFKERVIEKTRAVELGNPTIENIKELWGKLLTAKVVICAGEHSLMALVGHMGIPGYVCVPQSAQRSDLYYKYLGLNGVSANYASAQPDDVIAKIQEFIGGLGERNRGTKTELPKPDGESGKSEPRRKQDRHDSTR